MRIQEFLFATALVIAVGGVAYAGEAGTYFLQGSTTDYTQLNPDGTFKLVQRGQTFAGKYLVRENKLVLILPSGKMGTGKFDQDQIIDNQNMHWILRK